MSSRYQSSTKSESSNLSLFNIPQDLLLQLSVSPVLVALLGAKAASETLQAIGKASEEVFRGDRLPILEFPVKTELESD